MVLMPFILSLNPPQQSNVAAKGIESLTDPDDIQVPYGTPFASLGLPATVEATFTDSAPGTVAIEWSSSNYDEERSGVVTLIGTPVESATISNPDDLTVTIDVDVYLELADGGYVEIPYNRSLLGFTIHSHNSTHQWRERMLYNPADGKTYFTYGHSYLHKPYAQAKILVYDPDRGFDKPSNVGSILTVSDTHNVPCMQIADGRLNIFQEPVHDTPLRQSVSVGYDYSNFTTLGTIGTEISYAHPVLKDDGNWAIWHRGFTPGDPAPYAIWVVEASSGMTGWGAQRQITVKPAQAGDQRHYPFLPFNKYSDDTWIYLGISAVDPTIPAYYRNYILKTPKSGADCLKVFHNLQETFSKDVVAVSPLTDVELAANYSFMTMSNNTIDGGSGLCTISPEGHFYAIVADEPAGGSGSLYFKYYDEELEDYVRKPLTIAGGGEAIGQFYSVLYIIALSDNDIRYTERFTHGSFLKPHWIRTKDRGDTWEDLGDMNPEITDRHITRTLIPGNIGDIPPNTNFPIYFATEETGTDLSNLVCRVMAWGEAQAHPTFPIPTPAVSMNYNSQGLFHYICQDAYMTRTGTAINSLIDQFGIRDAPAGTNKPVWNNVDTATLSVASSHRFIPGTPASLVNKTALTFICVAKKQASTNSAILTFSLNSATTRYLDFLIMSTGIVRVQFVFTTTTQVDSLDAISDSDFHVITITLNGVNTIHISIDGKRQNFITNLGDAAADSAWDDIGTGPVNPGANIVNIGHRDLSSGDTYFDVTFKEMALFDGVLPIDEIRAREKMLCDDYGITYQGENQFQVP